MSYVDLHLHLLPGVDDGPPDDEAAVAFARRLVACGVREATVTPHTAHARFPLDVATIPERTAQLRSLLGAAGVPLVLHPGGELHPAGAGDLSADQLDIVAQGPTGARWVLLEAPFGGVSRRFLGACEHVRDAGFGLVIAHPERARGLLEDGLELLWPQLVSGAVLQVSVDSLMGTQGPEAREAAGQLVRRGLAYVVASDGHGGRRSQTLRDALAPLRAAGASAEHAWRLTSANPAFLLREGIGPEPARRHPAADWTTMPGCA
jgi:protein-tyrosine phosphatase